MPVSYTLMGNRFKGKAVPEPETDDFGDMLMSFLSTMFPHLLSIGIGIFLICMNKMVNDRQHREAETTVQVKSRSIAKDEPAVEHVSREIPMAPAPTRVTTNFSDSLNQEDDDAAPEPAPAPVKSRRSKPVRVTRKVVPMAPSPAAASYADSPAPTPLVSEKELELRKREEMFAKREEMLCEREEMLVEREEKIVEKIEKLVEKPKKPAPRSPTPPAEKPVEKVVEKAAPKPAPVEKVEKPVVEKEEKPAPKVAVPRPPSPEIPVRARAPAELVSVTKSENSAESMSTPCLKKLQEAFPKALPNDELINKVADALEEFGYGETTLLATSLCCDEVNRVLDEQFHEVYEHHFSMGGLAGFPFGGVTSFGAMAHHIPDGGSCLIVYGPHVGIDSHGNVGMIDRRGRANNGACCGSAADAANHVAEVRGGTSNKTKSKAPIRPLDAQQAFVRSMLMPYGKRLEVATESKVELPFALYDAMDDMMRQIVTFGAGEVAGDGKIALLGGIQINTPEEHEDYFLPLTFEIRDNHNLLIDNLMWW